MSKRQHYSTKTGKMETCTAKTPESCTYSGTPHFDEGDPAGTEYARQRNKKNNSLLANEVKFHATKEENENLIILAKRVLEFCDKKGYIPEPGLNYSHFIRGNSKEPHIHDLFIFQGDNELDELVDKIRLYPKKHDIKGRRKQSREQILKRLSFIKKS